MSAIRKVTYIGNASGYLVFDHTTNFTFYFLKGQEVAVSDEVYAALLANGHFGEGKLKLVP